MAHSASSQTESEPAVLWWDTNACLSVRPSVPYVVWPLLIFYAVVCVQMYYGGSEEDLSAVTDTMRYTGAAVPPRLSSRPAQAATDCHPSYAGTLTHPPADPTSFCEVRGHVST